VIKRVESPLLGEDNIGEVQKNILENLRGNALWQMGEKKEAKSIFDSLTKKPIPEGIRREIEIKVQAISTRGLEEKMRDYFSTQDETYQVVILEEVMDEFPWFSPAYYLLGRIFFLKGDYKKAMPILLKAESLGFSSKALQVENLRLSGIALFATRNYVGAKKRFEDMASLTQDEELRNYALDFIERCKWAQLNPI
jgi:tetratricopeptide (TPR) repeat protein